MGDDSAEVPWPPLLVRSRSPRRLGLQGEMVAFHIDEDLGELVLAGAEGGLHAVPLGEIERLLIGFETHKVTHWHAWLYVTGRRRAIHFRGSPWSHYRAAMWALVQVLERRGRLGVVRAGVTLNYAMGQLMVFGGFGLLLAAFLPYTLWERAAGLPRDDLHIPALVSVFGLVLAGWALRHYFRWDRPRRLREAEEILAWLP